MRPDIKALAFDLDGTMCQHKSPLPAEHRELLFRLKKHYLLVMVGAGTCARIFAQMEQFPVDIIGCYGMQYAVFNEETGTLDMVSSDTQEADRPEIGCRVTHLRQRFGFTDYRGDNTQFHETGMITIPLLGTDAALSDKLAFDPDRKKRRAIYKEVCCMFPEYLVYAGGSSSFDLTPRPYDKAYALAQYCTLRGFKHTQVVYTGDDYGPGGGDEAVYLSDFEMVTVDDYRDFPAAMAPFL